MKAYFYASYLNSSHKVDAASIIKAKSLAQIKRASMHLFENYAKFDSYKEAFDYLVLNCGALGYSLPYEDVRYADVADF